MSAPELPPGHEQYPIEYEPAYPGFGNVLSDECRVDGISSPSDIAVRYLGSGAAQLDPDGSRLGPGGTINLPGLGQGVWVPDNRPDGGGVHLRGLQDSEVDIIGYMSGHFAFTGGGSTIGSTVSLLQPQNPQPFTKEQNQQLAKDFADLLKARKDCLEFVSSLLSTVAQNTQRPLYNTDFISDPTKIFDAVQNGAALKPDLSYGGAQAWGSLSGGNAMVVIKNISWSGFSFVRGMTILHESLHLAAARGNYSDRELAWAGYQVAWAQGYKVNPPPATNHVMANSFYYDDLLFKACNPFQTKK